MFLYYPYAHSSVPREHIKETNIHVIFEDLFLVKQVKVKTEFLYIFQRVIRKFYCYFILLKFKKMKNENFNLVQKIFSMSLNVGKKST